MLTNTSMNAMFNTVNVRTFVFDDYLDFLVIFINITLFKDLSCTNSDIHARASKRLVLGDCLLPIEVYH